MEAAPPRIRQVLGTDIGAPGPDQEMADGLDGDGVKARVIAFWSTLFGYATISQVALLQPYMVGGLSADEIEVQIICTALGPELAAAMHGGRDHA